MAIDPLVDQALECYRLADDAESDLRTRMAYDLRFAAGEQWDQKIKDDRLADGKPTLVIDRLSGPIRQVVNQIRTARPGIQVHAVDSGTDVETAQNLQGLLRRIENNSDAEAAYCWAAEHQVKMGRGWWRVVTDYVSPTGLVLDSMSPTDFEQDIYIKRIKNQFAVYADPASVTVDGSDLQWAIIVEDLSREQYQSRFGKKTAYKSELGTLSLTEIQGTGDAPPNWLTEQTVRVAEYFYTEYENATFLLLADGTVVEKPQKRSEIARLGEVRAERVFKRPRIKWCLLNAIECLDRRDWPGMYIPVVPVYGEEWVIDGQTDYRGIVRMGIDPQRMINYERSTQVETVALAPRSPWLVDMASIAQYKQIWDTANRRNWAYLPYDSINKLGATAAVPQRMFGEPPIQAMVLLGQQFENDLRAATGFFDVQSQEQRPEQSGKAILARQRQGEVGNSHYLANLARSIKHTARICLDLMPHVYDTPRVMRILDVMDQPKVVAVGPQEATQQHVQQNGIQADALFDPRVGRYDITVSMGQDYQSARQENLELISQALQGNPQLWPMIGHFLFEQMDTPIAKQIAETLKPKTPEDVPPQVAQQMQQMQVQMQQLQELADKNRTDLMKAQMQVQAGLQEKQIDAQTREKIALIQATATMQATQAKVDAENARTIEEALEQRLAKLLDLKLEHVSQVHERMTQLADQLHEIGMAKLDHQHALQQGQQQAQIAASQQASQQAHDAGMAAMQQGANDASGQ